MCSMADITCNPYLVFFTKMDLFIYLFKFGATIKFTTRIKIMWYRICNLLIKARLHYKLVLKPSWLEPVPRVHTEMLPEAA